MSSSSAYTPQTSNAGLDQLNGQNSLYGQQGINTGLLQALNQHSQGNESSNDVLNTLGSVGPGAAGWAAPLQTQLENQLATGATTGSKFAAEQIGNNATQNSLYGANGQLGNTENLINQEENQGFNLTPGDQTLYGQEAGQIANQFGQQGNQAAQALASRGLSNSGAAGATFSGIAGNQNQMLADAQQQIAQQRFQNTQQQIAQNQNYAAQLGNQYDTALNNQYNRQLSGAQNQENTLSNEASENTSNNSANNSAQYQAQSTAGPGIGGALEGLGGMAAGAFTGGLAGGMGTGLAKSMFSSSGSGGGGGLSVPSAPTSYQSPNFGSIK